MFGPPAGMAQAGADLAQELLGVLKQPAVVHPGPDATFTGQVRKSAAAEAIIDAVQDADGLPMVVVCAGPLTNVADALLVDPSIAARFKLAWVGGSSGGNENEEYNYFTDPTAADFVLGNGELDIDQFPLEAYRDVVISVAELDDALRAGGAVGAWLWEHFHGLVVPDFIKFGPLWCLGDSAPLVVTGLAETGSTFVEVSDAPRRRMCQSVDTRLVVSDFLAQLRLQAR
ncbi:nucleoside hydrolase [Paenarthrobacter sp. NPDC089989]|uniref:nucleoside hydrolase n=1 Tax=unclassified Paenarthrobacter TaxID=2634190 RepID=UPI00382F1EA5